MFDHIFGNNRQRPVALPWPGAAIQIPSDINTGESNDVDMDVAGKPIPAAPQV